MATNITPRRESGDGGQTPGVFHTFFGLRDEMNHLFDDFFSDFGRRTPSLFRTHEPAWLLGRRRGAMTPAVDIVEDDKAITLTAELPGMKEDDIEIVLRDDVLTVKGEKKSETREEEENYYLTERHYGAFERTFRLPDTAIADKIKAAYEDGLLRVVIPKRPEARKIEKKIKVAHR